MAAKMAAEIASGRNNKYVKINSHNFINIQDKGTLLVSMHMFLTMPDPMTP